MSCTSDQIRYCIYKGHPEIKERLRIQSAHMFCCNRSLVSGIERDAENCLMQLYVGPCHVASAEIAVVMAVPIEKPADCEVRGVIRFLQADEILVILPKRQVLAWNCSVARKCTSAYCSADTRLIA